jgi:hypothetical protein
LNDASIKPYDTNKKWIWVNNNTTLTPNSNVLLSIKTNQGGLFIAEQSSYSAPGQSGITTLDYIKVSYD